MAAASTLSALENGRQRSLIEPRGNRLSRWLTLPLLGTIIVLGGATINHYNQGLAGQNCFFYENQLEPDMRATVDQRYPGYRLICTIKEAVDRATNRQGFSR